MKETGELLKNRRLEKKYSLEEISSQTKIQLSILKSLEEGRQENLKNKTYTKGFLRQYARALQLNPEDVIALFEKEAASVAEATPVTAVNKLKAEAPIQEKTNVLWFRAPAKVITVAGVILIGSLATAIYFFSMKMASYSQETFKEPVATEETTDPAAAAPPPSTDPAATPAATTPAATPAPTAKDAATPAAAPAKTETPAAAKPKDETAPPTANKLNKEISIVAKENITIEASWVTGQKETVQLKANGKHTFYYPKKITLVISNGGAVEVTANGEKLGATGEAGQPVTLSFD
jgi:cytoskeletal protein RodZ